ncbi:CCA tRNA nucleotidyltransferase [Thalassobius sp. S69A]|uniref:CCA tRNA nucleotidyltransferase n=1 Tax=unclassified Thalassovita TaxID=2619711 RepID=UPI000C0D0177|nr:CCA tRNA nucleotidyltransferase [Paracoccaceae bacterium]MBT27034.1 CCA tRNA nucleotidyltransferase [Paracoccaceae bacterium]
MKVSGDWIENPATQAVCKMLEQGGHQAYFVGGCVRNALIGAEVADIDISTDARPEQVLGLARKTGLKSVPTGIDHGTVTVISGGIPHEITTFRRDVETDGRRAIVAFSTDILEDALRRDFTMNALYADKAGRVLDPLNAGLVDLGKRQIRFIEDPEQRIKEDYLRILRFFRFYAWYGDPEQGLDADGLAAIAGNIDGLAGLSAERVGAELLKLLNAPDPAPAVAAMQASAVLSAVVPGADARGVTILVHQEVSAHQPPDALRRLACLGGESLGQRLRLSKAQQRRLEQLRSGIESTLTLPEIAYRQGPQMAVDVALLRAVAFETPVCLDRAQIDRAATAIFPLTGRDLMPGLSGAELGAALKRLEQAWIASGFALSKQQLLEML